MTLHSSRHATKERDQIQAARLVMIDLDGVLVFGARPHPDAARFLASLDRRYIILTNNSTDTPTSLARWLARAGIPVRADSIITAGQTLLDTLGREARGRRTMLLAGPYIRRAAARTGVTLVADDPDVVALARDTTLTYARLQAAIASLSRGADLLVANPDLTHPGTMLEPVPETGALLATLSAAVPHARPRILGKPSPEMFRCALDRLGAAPHEAVMIGDNPDTDGAGAAAAGIPAIIVGSRGRHTGIEDFMP